LNPAGPIATRGFALADVDLVSFDRRFGARCRVQRPDRYRLLDALPDDAPRIARGGGVSYVAASFGGGAISQSMAAFDRIVAFDDEAGRITVEAGARVGDVQRFALARGWYLAVAPGHPAATIGGCIAADVHGKNPARDGTFRAVVERFEILIASGDTRVASESENAELFDATFAGFGLTGLVTRATLRLARPPTALIVRRVPVANLVDAARILRDAANAPVLYGWHDGSPKHFGRGVIRIGLASDVVQRNANAVPSSAHDLPARIEPWPFSAWNRVGIAFANAWLRARWCRAGEAPLPLASALFPLNDARAYFAGFGKRGMSEAQWLIPHARFEAFSSALGECVARDRPRIALIASKLFSGGARGFSFDGDGVALAIQVPAPDDARQRAFLDALGEIAIAHGGRANLIKSSTLDAATARSAIGDFEAARARLAAFNPGGRHASELSRRIAL
jgi:decaprenylphospho-beta-D-ribofuranose 2-oxidase